MSDANSNCKLNWIEILKNKFKEDLISHAEKGHPWGYSQRTIRPVGPDAKEINLFAFYIRRGFA